jgi:hypothetical protein
MKTKVMIVLMLGALATTGSQCINDDFLVAVNLPIPICHAINPGPNTFLGKDSVNLVNQIDPTYLGKLKAARFYDIQVWVTGTYDSTIVGDAYIVINNVDYRLVHFGGRWADFKTPMSILNGGTKLTIDNAGIQKLTDVLNQFVATGRATVVLKGAGTLYGQTPVPSGLTLCIEVFAQADAQIK